MTAHAVDGNLQNARWNSGGVRPVVCQHGLVRVPLVYRALALGHAGLGRHLARCGIPAERPVRLAHHVHGHRHPVRLHQDQERHGQHTEVTRTSL